jgi:hypothetical protein
MIPNHFRVAYSLSPFAKIEISSRKRRKQHPVNPGGRLLPLKSLEGIVYEKAQISTR